MSYRLFPFGSSLALDRPRGPRTRVGAFVVACAACLIPFAASAADFTVSPTNLVFGGVPLGATATVAVTITNTSGVSQTPNFSGGAPFDPVNFGGFQNCAGVPLAPGGSCQFTYQFHPTTLGAISSGTTVGINSENFSITMAGTGISAFSVAPTNLAFGSVLVGIAAGKEVEDMAFEFDEVSDALVFERRFADLAFVVQDQPEASLGAGIHANDV